MVIVGYYRCNEISASSNETWYRYLCQKGLLENVTKRGSLISPK